jgi:hypothetical protein
MYVEKILCVKKTNTQFVYLEFDSGTCTALIITVVILYFAQNTRFEKHTYNLL